MKFKNLPCVLAIFSLIAAISDRALAQGTAFNYQGRLNVSGNPATGIYDLQCTMFADAVAPLQTGESITNLGLGVTNGAFTLTLDFGSNVFYGDPRWLEISVRTNGGPSGFTVMNPRQKLTPTPYAIFAGSAANATSANTAAVASSVSSNAVAGGGIQNNTITAAKLAAGQVVKTLNGLTDNVTLSAGANVTLTTNGNTLQLSSSGGAASGWALRGNAGTTPGLNYVGTSDAQPLELRVGGNRVMRFERDPLFGGINVIGGDASNLIGADGDGNSGSGDFIGGGAGNTISAAVSGATIGGGGGNTIQSIGGTIGGGSANLASTSFATIGGGAYNTSSGQYASVGGGYNNNASGNFASVAGGSGSYASGIGSFAAGNNNGATGDYASIPGGSSNYAFGVGSFAAGVNAHVLYNGSFIWGDGTQRANSTGPNRFEVLATGGISFYTGGNNVNIAPPAALAFGGTTRQMLDLYGTGYGIGVQNYTLYSRSGGGFAWYLGGAHDDNQNNPGGGTTLMTLNSVGNLSISNSAPGGTAVVGYALAINSAGVAGVGDAAGSTGVYGRGTKWGGYFDGPVSVCTLTIRGGCDVAEPFQMSDQEIPKGSVVVIDDQNAGQLRLSDRAYDSRVAGIVSGANGIKPGISLSQEGILEGGQNVALSGRVYVLADASTGEIKPGDLLTTSSTPGHAMKVTNHNQTQGAILGKAMSSLKQGKGMVLVLVTLQ